MKKIYIYEVEIIIDGEEISPIFTDSASEALDAFKSFKSVGVPCRLYKRGELIMSHCRISYEI